MNFNTIRPEDIKGNLIQRIRDQWMLIGVGTEEKANSMVGSWGFMGEMWNKDVAVCVVRPQRFTYEFMETHETYSLSFYSQDYRKTLNQFGTKSGRDIAKVDGGPLTPAYKHGTLYYEEAEMIIFCRKLYSHIYKAEEFADKSLIDACYDQGDFHRAYYGEIIEVLCRY